MGPTRWSERESCTPPTRRNGSVVLALFAAALGAELGPRGQLGLAVHTRDLRGLHGFAAIRAELPAGGLGAAVGAEGGLGGGGGDTRGLIDLPSLLPDLVLGGRR